MSNREQQHGHGLDPSECPGNDQRGTSKKTRAEEPKDSEKNHTPIRRER